VLWSRDFCAMTLSWGQNLTPEVTWIHDSEWSRLKLILNKNIYEPLRAVSYDWFRNIKEDISQFVFKSLGLRFAQSEQYRILFEDLNSSRYSFCRRDLARFGFQTGNGGLSRDSWRVQKRTFCS